MTTLNNHSNLIPQPTPSLQQQQQQQQQQTTSPDLDTLVLAYLQKRGYSSTSETLKHEAKLSIKGLLNSLSQWNHNALARAISLYDSESANPEYLVNAYKKLKNWVENSLDAYRVSLKNSTSYNK